MYSPEVVELDPARCSNCWIKAIRPPAARSGSDIMALPGMRLCFLTVRHLPGCCLCQWYTWNQHTILFVPFLSTLQRVSIRGQNVFLESRHAKTLFWKQCLFLKPSYEWHDEWCGSLFLNKGHRLEVTWSVFSRTCWVVLSVPAKMLLNMLSACIQTNPGRQPLLLCVLPPAPARYWLRHYQKLLLRLKDMILIIAKSKKLENQLWFPSRCVFLCCSVKWYRGFTGEPKVYLPTTKGCRCTTLPCFCHQGLEALA